MRIIIRMICIAIACFWFIRLIIDIVSTYSRAKRNVIIKACINPRAALIVLIAVGLMSIGICVAFGKASDANENKGQWEQLRNTEYSEYYKEYYNEQIAGKSGIEITDFNKFVEQQIGRYSGIADIYIYTGTVCLVMTLFLLLESFNRVFYITENGCISYLLKEPEKLIAECYGGKINFYFEAVQERKKPLISFKATAENLAVLGRFIEGKEKNEVEDGENSLLHTDID